MCQKTAMGPFFLSQITETVKVFMQAGGLLYA